MRRFDLAAVSAVAALIACSTACSTKKPTPTPTEATPSEGKPTEAKAAANVAKPAGDEAKPAADEAKGEIPGIPKGYWTVTPGLVLDDIDAAAAYYEKAFGAKTLFKMPGPDGKTLHAEVLIGDTHVMLGLADGRTSLKSPTAAKGTTGSLQIAVADADAVMTQAVAAGGKVAYPIQDQFWGDRQGLLTDPFGHSWGIATTKVLLTDAQIGEAAKLAFIADKTKAAEAVAAAWAKGTPAKSYRRASHNDVTASLHLKNDEALEAFYVKALGGTLLDNMPMLDGSLMHATVELGNSVIMFSQEMPAYGSKSPETLGATTMYLYLYFEDVDAAMKRAEAASAKVTMPTMDMFWGDRAGQLQDSSGHLVNLATHKQDLTPKEMMAGLKKIMVDPGAEK